MSTKVKKIFQLLVIGILLISFISMTLCTGDENGDDEDDNGNGNGGGNNGNGNGNNNTTNGDNEVIKFIDVHHTPESPNVNGKVQFDVKIESDNPIVSVSVIVCKSETGICYAAEKMTESPPNSKIFIHEWNVPPDVKSGEKLSFHISAKDSLDTIGESKDYEFTVA